MVLSQAMFDRINYVWDWTASLTPAGEAMNGSGSFEEYELRLEVCGDESRRSRSFLVKLFASFLGTSRYLKFSQWLGYAVSALTGCCSGLVGYLEFSDKTVSVWRCVLRASFDVFALAAAGFWLHVVIGFFCFALAVQAMSSLVSWRYEPFRKAESKSLFEKFMDCLAFRRVREWYHVRKLYLDDVRRAN